MEGKKLLKKIYRSFIFGEEWGFGKLLNNLKHFFNEKLKCSQYQTFLFENSDSLIKIVLVDKKIFLFRLKF